MSTTAPPKARQLIVRRLAASATRGRLQLGALSLPCALGRSGVKARKREGDGATPRGRFFLRELLYNPLHLRRPRSGMAMRAISCNDGWCDEACDRNYNRPVRLPYSGRAEEMWRNDGLYDLVVVVGYNDAPRVRGRGSAIFIHIARDGFQPTQGCVALKRADLIRLVAHLNRATWLVTDI